MQVIEVENPIRQSDNPWAVKGPTYTVQNPVFLPNGSISGVCHKNETDYFSVSIDGSPVHPINVLAGFFPIVLIRWNGWNWIGTDDVKTVIIYGGKIFGIK
jgi:hypothetical protein